jgi:hypothetical protein
MEARFLITDIMRAIRDKTLLKTAPDYVVRDYLNPTDFYQMVDSLLKASPINVAVDCYTLAPVEKIQLLETMKERFGLCYEFADSRVGVNATGYKPNYYSMNRRAEDFGYKPSLTSLEGIVKEVSAIQMNIL